MASTFLQCLLIVVLVVPIVPAQSTGPKNSVESEEKETRIQRHKKALTLLEEISEEMQSFKLPENYIRLRVALADLFWSKDQERARSLFQEAASKVREMSLAVDSGDPNFYNLAHLPAQLRQEMVQLAARRDPRCALDFLRTTRPAANQQRLGYNRSNFEAQLEMNIAMELADKEPNEAVRIGAEALNHAVDHQALSLLHKLMSQNNGAAERFFEQIMVRLRREELNTNSAAAYLVLNLLSNWAEKERAKSDLARSSSVNVPANLDHSAARELYIMLFNAVLKVDQKNHSPYRSQGPQTFSILQQLKPLMPQIEKLPGVQLEAVRKRMAEFEKSQEVQPWAKYQELVQTGTVEALVEAAKTAPPEYADNLIRQATWKAFNQGDVATARQIAERIADPRIRAEILLDLDRQMFYRASQKEKLVEARSLLANLPSVEEKASFLVQLARTAISSGNKSSAVQLLTEAEALFSDRALSYQQLVAQLQIAAALKELDAARSTNIIERAIDHLNELAAAAGVLNGFDIQQYFRDGEFVINNGNSLCSTTQELARQLNAIATKDFDQARSLGDRFERPEMRVMALLQIVQGALSDSEGTAGTAPPAPGVTWNRRRGLVPLAPRHGSGNRG